MDTSAMIASANEASLRLMQQVGSQDKGNVWISPVSLGMALRTIYQGAKGETAKELAPFVTMVAMENNNLLQIADAVWIQPILPVKKDYLQWCKEQQREIYNESITATKVNDWASRHTQGKINKVLEDPVGKDLMMLIANAVYFKAEWETPFEERGTHNETFYAADGTQMQVKMMEKTAHYDYAKTATEEVLNLYYRPAENGKRYVMHVILPKAGMSVENLLTNLTTAKMDTWDEVAKWSKVNLKLPKLTLSYERLLNEDLQTLGVRSAFSTKADFSGISSKPLCIDIVKQNTFLRIDEQGTEAAAVTVIGMKAMAMPPQREEIIPFHVNRPYLLILRDADTDAILFMGKIKKFE